jgi:hypothetical protein
MEKKDIQSIVGAALQRFSITATTSITIIPGANVSIIVPVDSKDKKKENCIRKDIQSNLDMSVKSFSFQLETSSMLDKAASLSFKVKESLENERGTLVESSHTSFNPHQFHSIELTSAIEKDEDKYTLPLLSDPNVDLQALQGLHIMIVGGDIEEKELVTKYLIAIGATVTSQVTRNGKFCCFHIYSFASITNIIRHVTLISVG